jgi:hypothetical protein
MARRKGSPRVKSAPADEPLRRGRRDDEPPDKKPVVADKILRAGERESEILPGVPLS